MAKPKNSRSRRNQALKKKKQQEQFMLIGGGLVAVIAIMGAVIFFLAPGEADVAELGDERFDVYNGIPFGEDSQADREVEQASDVADGVTRGLTEEGIPYIGSLDAPIVVADFSDFSCGYCAQFEEESVDRLISDYVRNGQVRFEFYPVTLSSFGQPSVIAARSAICAAEQGAFWEYHKELFNIHRQEGYQAFDRGRVEDLASDMGLDSDELERCVNDSSNYRLTMATSENMQRTLGVTGTPTVFYRVGTGNWQRVNADYGSITAAITPHLSQ